MKTINPTEEQLRAIRHDGATLVLRASAGTGKTATLVARYLRHVSEDGLRPDQILTLTFTRKAAAEMKLRIVKALAEEGRRDDAQIAETGPIQTIHGFCERVLRECSIDAGIDPDFEVLDETEASRRMTEAIRLAIAGAEKDGYSRALVEKLAGRARYQSLSPHGLLEETVRSLVHSLRGSTLDLPTLRANHSSPDALIDRWKQIMLEAAPPAVREAMAALGPGESFGLRLKRAYRGIREGVPRGLPTETTAEAAEAMDARCAADTCGMVQLGCLTWQTYEEENRHAGVLDFVELERRTVELLHQSGPAVLRLREQFQAVLVDEAQDLNPIQNELIETIGIGRRLFVGDAQQSIYAFRQADVELFRRRASEGNSLPLTKNHRSRANILHFVDHLFGELWKDDYLPMGSGEDGEMYGPGIELWRQKVKDTRQVAEWIRDLLDEGERPRDVAVLVRSGGYAQALLARLEALGVPARIIGGSERYYLRLEVRDMANALSALADPYDDFALLAVLNSPLAGLSMDSIVLLAQGGRVFESLADFEPPVEQDASRIARFCAWFEPLARFADRQPAWELLSRLLASSPYLEAVATHPRGRQIIANVRKLLAIAAQMPDADARTFSRRMREIRELRHHEGDAPASEDQQNEVSILTIHKAKGLEFETVVVPETLGKERPMGDLEIDKRLGLITVKFEAGGSMFHQFNAELRKARDREEELRLLYVAFTRAKRRLCFVANPGGRDTTLAGLIPQKLGWEEGAPPHVRVREPATALPENREPSA